MTNEEYERRLSAAQTPQDVINLQQEYADQLPQNEQSVSPGRAVETPAGYISREELNEILEARDRKHAEAMASVRAKLPVAMVPAHSAGPGIDQHQVSWNLAEQEAAARGDVLDHWVIRD